MSLPSATRRVLIAFGALFLASSMGAEAGGHPHASQPFHRLGQVLPGTAGVPVLLVIRSRRQSPEPAADAGQRAAATALPRYEVPVRLM